MAPIPLPTWEYRSPRGIFEVPFQAPFEVPSSSNPYLNSSQPLPTRNADSFNETNGHISQTGIIFILIVTLLLILLCIFSIKITSDLNAEPTEPRPTREQERAVYRARLLSRFQYLILSFPKQHRKFARDWMIAQILNLDLDLDEQIWQEYVQKYIDGECAWCAQVEKHMFRGREEGSEIGGMSFYEFRDYWYGKGEGESREWVWEDKSQNGQSGSRSGLLPYGTGLIPGGVRVALS